MKLEICSEKEMLELTNENFHEGSPDRNFFEIRRCFSKIAGKSADTAVNLVKTADALIL